MSANLDERIVSIKFDNSGFEEKASETQKQLEELNKSLEFDNAKKGVSTLTDAFKNIGTEAKKVDVSPISEGVENVKEKFSALETVAVGALLKIGSDAVEAGKKLIKAFTIDPISEGFKKYESILTSEMTLTAALGGETADEIETNKQRIADAIEELTWYADETSYSLEDMISNMATMVKYGMDIDIVKDVMMGIANASAKSGAPIWKATHAFEGFAKAMGMGYMTQQVWRTWIRTSSIDTIEFKNVLIDTAKEFAKQNGSIGKAILKNGELYVNLGKTLGNVKVTAEGIEQTMTKGQWLTKDVMTAAIMKYSAAMDDLYLATNKGEIAVSDFFDSTEYGFDDFSTQAFMFGQRCKTLQEVIEAVGDATSTTWNDIFKAIIGNYEETIPLWTNLAEQFFTWFVYPLQKIEALIVEVGHTTSNILNETTGEAMTLREVLVDSLLNVLKAITSVLTPIKEAFLAVFKPFETIPDKVQNGVEKFHEFTKSIILTKEESAKLRTVFITIFSTIQKIVNVVKTIINIIKKTLFPIIKKIGGFIINIIKRIGTSLLKFVSTISSFISRVFGIRDVIADLKEDILEAAESVDEVTDAYLTNAEVMDRIGGEYTSYGDILQEIIDMTNDFADATDDLTEAEEKNAKSAKKSSAANQSYVLPNGYDGKSYLSYQQAQEKANNEALADFIKEKNITEKQYNKLIELMGLKESGVDITVDEMIKATELQSDTFEELVDILNETRVAYIQTDKAVSDILNKDKEAGKWETIWDGINEAQRKTLITYGEQQAALDLYFNKNIKDYSEIAKKLEIEEWKIRTIIDAYKEAYAVENYLSKKRMEATSDNIDAARQELGYIEKREKAEETVYKSAYRQEIEARIAERNALLAARAEAATGKSLKKQSKNLKLSNEIRNSIQESADSSEKLTKKSNDVVKSIDAVNEVIDDTATSSEKASTAIGSMADSVLKVGTFTENSADSVKSGTEKMADAFKTLDLDVEESSKNIEKNIDKVNKKTNKKPKSEDNPSLVEQVEEIFGDNDNSGKKEPNQLKQRIDLIFELIKEKAWKAFNLIKEKASEKVNEIYQLILNKFKELRSKSVQEVFDPIISKIKEMWTALRNIFSNMQSDFSGFFKAPFQTIETVIKDLKTAFSSIFKKEGKEDGAGVGIAATDILSEETKNVFLASLDDLLNKTWKKIKQFFKDRVDAVRNDESNPFYGIVHMMDNIIDWWDDFSFDVKLYFDRIKAAINLVFGPGTLWDKLSSGVLWRPFLDAMVGVIDKFDLLERTIPKIKNSLKKGFKEAFDSLDDSSKTAFDNIKNKFQSISDYIQEFTDNVKLAKAILTGEGVSGGGGGDADKIDPTGGLVGFVANLSIKWDEFKEKLQTGISWDTIVKVNELELILERLVKAVANAWIKIGLAKMAMDIGSFFSSIGDGIENLSEPLKKNKDLGKTLIEIAIAIAILAASFYAISQLDAEAIQRATDAMQAIAAVLVPIFTAVAGFTRLMQGGGTFGHATSIPQALGNGLESLFGQKNTMRQAALLVLGIAAGIYLMVEAFAVLADATKDMSDEQWKRTLETLGLIAGIITAAIIAIRLIVGKLGEGKGGLSLSAGGIDIREKTIQKTISPLAEILKAFAIALGTLIAGFVAVSYAIDKFLTYDDGSIRNGKFAAVAGILGGMVVAVGAMMIITTNQAKKLQNIDIKALKVFEKIMTPFITGMATLIYGFQKLANTIDELERPKTFKHASILLFSMILAVGLLMFITVALAKWITGESSSNVEEMSKTLGVSDSGMLGIAKSFSKSKTKSSKGDVAEAIKSISGIAISLGFGIKLIASAFSTIVSAIDSIQNKGTFGKSIGIFIGIIAAMALLIGELGFIATKIPLNSADTFKAMAWLIVAVGASVWIMADAIADLSKAFNKILKSGSQGEEAINKALETIAIFLGAIVILFGIIAAVSGTGAGAVVTAVAAAALVAIATAILEIATAVYVFAKGLELLVDVLIKVASANDAISKGLDNLIDLMPKVKTLIIEVMKALIAGLIEGLIAARADIAKFLVETLDSVLDTLAKYLPKIAEKLDAIKEPLNKICDWIGDFLRERFHHFVQNAELMRDDAQKLLTGAVSLLISSLINGLIDARTDIIKEIIASVKELLDTLDKELPGILKSLKSIIHQIRQFILDEISDFLDYCETQATIWADGITDIIVAIINGISNSYTEITTALENLLLTWADGVVSLFETGGTVLARLLTIPAKVVGSIIAEFRNLIQGGSMMEQIFGNMGEGDTIEEKAGSMWDRLANAFMDKDHASINEAQEISESSKKWGIYIVNGLVAGLATVPKELKSNIDTFWKAINDAYGSAAGFDEKGNANTSGAAYKLGIYTVKGILKGLKDWSKNSETKNAANALWKEIDKEFRKSAKIKSPSKEAYKWGQYIGRGLTNGIEKSSTEVGQAAVYMWKSFEDPMTSEMTSFAAVTSSMLAQLLDADMDFNPVITPVFDMSNIDAASASMSEFFESQEAVEAAASFNNMKNSNSSAFNQNMGENGGNSTGPTYNYVQNNYSPKALPAIEIYRRTKNQLNFRTALGG